MIDIFLSYAREDKDYARTIALALEKEGIDVWWDHNIAAGQNFASVTEKAIDDSKCVVVLWSRHSINSEWVHVESSEGKRRNILVPILIEDVKIPLAFRMRQTANLINWNNKPTDPLFERLLVDIRLIIHGGETKQIKEAKRQEEEERKLKEKADEEKVHSDEYEKKDEKIDLVKKNKVKYIFINRTKAFAALSIPFVFLLLLWITSYFTTYSYRMYPDWPIIIILAIIYSTVIFRYKSRKIKLTWKFIVISIPYIFIFIYLFIRCIDMIIMLLS